MSPSERERRTLLLVSALRTERAALGWRLGADVRAERCGMGPHRAAEWLRRRDGRAPFRAAAVLGLAGALDPGLRPGDVVVASEVRDGTGSVALPGSAPLVAALAAAGIPVHRGPVLTAPAVLDRRAKTAAAGGALAVDLESAPLVRGLRASSGAPVAVVRVIVDAAEEALLRPATAVHGVQALLRLRRVAPAVVEWGRCVQYRDVLLAGPRSFCAGVERAINAVERSLELYPHPVYVRREIVHNAHVVGELRRRGAVFVQELAEVPEGGTVVFSAHGVARGVRTEARRRGLTVVDATCPLVGKVHQEVVRFADEDRSVLLIGHAGHDETEGTLGQLPGRVQLVESPADAERVRVEDPARVAVLTQTTLAPEDTVAVLDVLRRRFPLLVEPGSDDICYATTNRQQAVRAIAAEAEVVLVVGSANSSNSHRLVEVARRCGTAAHLIDDATAIQPSWLAGRRTVGLTAGASAPPQLVEDVLETLRGLGGARVQERTVARETQTFAAPRAAVD